MRLAADGHRVCLGARLTDRLEKLAGTGGSRRPNICCVWGGVTRSTMPTGGR